MVCVKLFVVLAMQVSACVVLSADECKFTSDCESVNKCKNIQDTSCVCKFGECVFDGNPFFRNNECTSYTDCPCRRTPDSCFCRDKTCENEAWECRTKNDCKKLDKCDSDKCRCSSYNTCELKECTKKSDCLNGTHFCNTLADQGYTCKCNDNACDIVLEVSPPSPPAPPSPFKTDNFGPPLNLDAFGPPLNIDGVSPPAPPPLTSEQRTENKSCTFTEDCNTVESCIGIQDAACVCKRGQCILDGNPFFRGNECKNYTDCGCRNNPSNCFCRNDFCVEDDWECHEKEDCEEMKKCEGVDVCRCSYNDLCEPVECTTTKQCLDQGAACVDEYEGYTCKCERNVCNLTPNDAPN